MLKVVLLYLILFLHLAGLVFRWYWHIPNYDTFIHFLGGFWVAMITTWLLDRWINKSHARILLIIGITMAVGLSWEGYEFLADTFILKRHFIQDSLLDTTIDLIADFFGGLAYVALSIRSVNLYEIHNKRR